MNKFFGIALAGVAVAASAFIGYKVATDRELRHRLSQRAIDVFKTSKMKVDAMSEDVAIRTAQLTNNPKVNQEFVENQWDALGL